MADLDSFAGDLPFLSALASLPGSYDGPDGLRDGPYGAIGFGEAEPAARLLAGWTDAPLVASGTQFVLAGGFEFGELGPTVANISLAGADPLVLGFGIYDPAFRVEPGPLATYPLLAYLAHATGHADAWRDAEHAMGRIAEAFAPKVPSETNPAKRLAWTLWNRVPLLLTGRPDAALQPLAQQVLARVGRSLAIPTGAHPSGVVTGAFEGRHALGDDVVGLVLGVEEGEVPLAREVLGTRIPEIVRLPLPEGLEPPADPVVRGVVLWYALCWVAVYLSLLHDHEPGESPVYTAVRDAATDPEGDLARAAEAEELDPEQGERALN